MLMEDEEIQRRERVKTNRARRQAGNAASKAKEASMMAAQRPPPSCRARLPETAQAALGSLPVRLATPAAPVLLPAR